MIIYVKIIDEDVDVWCPVEATPHETNVYQIDEQPYDREIETWQFEPGEKVYCELINSDQWRILAATRKVWA